jgi:predicted nucleic acid-binding protein
MYLLDTNSIIKYLDGSLNPNGVAFMNKILDDKSAISIITKIETLGFNFTVLAEQENMEYFVNNSTIMEMSNDVVNKTIVLRKRHKIKLPDAIIAATAIVYDFSLITGDKYFKNITELNTIDPNSL